MSLTIESLMTSFVTFLAKRFIWNEWLSIGHGCCWMRCRTSITSDNYVDKPAIIFTTIITVMKYPKNTVVLRDFCFSFLFLEWRLKLTIPWQINDLQSFTVAQRSRIFCLALYGFNLIALESLCQWVKSTGYRFQTAVI